MCPKSRQKSNTYLFKPQYNIFRGPSGEEPVVPPLPSRRFVCSLMLCLFVYLCMSGILMS